MNKAHTSMKIDQEDQPSVLTNMAFWQSSLWLERVDSIYDMTNRDGDPTFYSPCREAYLLWKQRKQYDIILTLGARASLFYGLFCLLTGKNSRQIMMR